MLALALAFAVLGFVTQPDSYAMQSLRAPLAPLEPAALGLSCVPDAVTEALICHAAEGVGRGADWQPLEREALVFAFPPALREGERASVTITVEDPRERLRGRSVTLRVDGAGFSVLPAAQALDLTHGNALTFEIIAQQQGRSRLIANISAPLRFLRVVKGTPLDLDALWLERFPNQLLDIDVHSRFWALGLNQAQRAAIVGNAWAGSAVALALAAILALVERRRRR